MKNHKGKSTQRLEWGVVKVVGGKHKGRIGYLDDEEEAGIAYFGNFFYAPRYHLIPFKHLAPITTDDLMRRHQELFQLIGMPNTREPYGRLSDAEEHIEHLTEYALVQSELMDRMFTARLTESNGKRVFISHSSKDKQFATWLSVDLANHGHNPWLDEWKIRAGESIPTKIGEGLENCDFVVVVLSENAVASHWVEREWQAKYWDEVAKGKIRVIPVLLRECKIPTLLRVKKYADFSISYNNGLEDLLVAIASQPKRSNLKFAKTTPNKRSKRTPANRRR
jgi:hypothetical protein